MAPKVSQEYLDARRRQILEAACTCFSRKGFHQTTIGDICDEAGLSTGAVYGHFEDKEEMIRAAAGQARARLERFLEEARSEADARRGLEQLVGALTACAMEPGEEGLESVRLEIHLWSAALHDPNLRDIVEEWYSLLLPETEELVRRIRDETGGADSPRPELVARTIVAAIQGVLLQRVVDPEADLDLRPVLVGLLAGDGPSVSGDPV